MEISMEKHIEHQRALFSILEEIDRVCRKLDIKYMLFAGTMLGAVRHKGFIPWDDDLDVVMLREDYDRFLKEAEKVIDNKKFFLQKEFSEHWPLFFSKLRLNGTTCLEKFHPKDKKMHQGIYIDIFPCDNAFENDFLRKLQFAASKIVIAKALDKRGYETESIAKKAFIFVCRFLPAKPFLKFVKGGKKNGKTLHSFFAAASNYSKNIYPRNWFTETKDMDFESGKFPVSAHCEELLTVLYGDYMVLPPEEERTIKQHAILVDTEKSFEEYSDYRNDMEFEVHTRSIR